MDIKLFRQIASVLHSENIEEMEWKDGEFYLKLRRFKDDSTNLAVIPQTSVKVESIPDSTLIDAASKDPAPGNTFIISPIVGTFYRAPSPKADPYAKEGDKVKKGQILCILEAMKLMNELEAEFPCEIVRVVAGNAQPVEFGEPLFEVKPLL